MARPLFAARTRAALRDLNNRVTDNAARVTLERARRNPDGSLVSSRYGVLDYEPPVEYPALVTYKQVAVRTKDNQERTSTGVVQFSFPAPAVTTDDRITLPDGARPPILAVVRDLSDDPVAPTRVFV